MTRNLIYSVKSATAVKIFLKKRPYTLKMPTRFADMSEEDMEYRGGSGHAWIGASVAGGLLFGGLLTASFFAEDFCQTKLKMDDLGIFALRLTLLAGTIACSSYAIYLCLTDSLFSSIPDAGIGSSSVSSGVYSRVSSNRVSFGTSSNGSTVG